jgi:hypothetical protein
VTWTAELREDILDEVCLALGFRTGGFARRTVGLLLRYPAGRFAGYAARTDQRIAEAGLQTAAGELLSHFVEGVVVRGEEHIPRTGALLVACNHPGAYDSVAIAAHLPRPDLKAIASDVPFLRGLAHARAHLIYASPAGVPDAYGHMLAARMAIRHLQAGGALLTFPTGRIDPDPALLPGAAKALEDWSHSLELFLRQAPETSVVVTIASGVLAAGPLRNPLTRLAGEPWKRQRIAEYVQVIQQLAFRRKFDLWPRLTFGAPVSAAELVSDLDGARAALIERARALLEEHMAYDWPG